MGSLSWITVMGLWLILFFTVACSIARKTRRPDKPNIILILADDLGWNEVSWHNERIKTPTLQIWNAERGCGEMAGDWSQHLHTFTTGEAEDSGLQESPCWQVA